MQATRRAFAILVAVSLTACATAQTSQTAPTQARAEHFIIATPAQAAPIFTAGDEFMAVVTPADISIRTRSAEGTRADLVRTYAGAFEPWTEAETARLEAMLSRRGAQLQTIARWLPETVLLVKSNGAADTSLPHTRGNAINMGQHLPDSDEELDGLFFHELFHVLSRRNAARHDETYALIGFIPCSVELPQSVRDQTVTNPDAPLLRWATSPDANGRSIVPVLFGNPPRWDPAQPQFNRYFNLRFLQATRNAAGQCAVTIENGQPVDIPGDQAVPAIHAVAGANTNYVLHAEELLADNFSQLMMGRTDAPNPEVQARLATFLGIAP
ncbi:hypothetical protein [Terricaulis silvestris]|uniref:Uncharacterized protein n=1 Tax=Terricaulis silvestris TaxID=2686094 RepID=A0A6I6MHG2_9CAUL|nr:hypothetical protein [Terricaulis silvestris]QGZ94325.1 hypothetical protein DSM104635_01143 [Terricaulis silvestris]